MTPEPVTCKICANIIFKEDDSIHFGCIATREKTLTEMVSFLHDQLDSMKKTFNSVKRVLGDLEKTLYMTNPSDVPESIEVPPTRIVRETTRIQTHQLPKGRSKSAPKSKNRARSVSPLVVPNGTTNPQQIVVTPNNNNSGMTTTLQSSISAQPSSSQSSSQSDPSTQNQPPATSVPSTQLCLDDPEKEDLSPEIVCGITVVPPPKSIFLSRLGVDVTADQVKMFITTKIPAAQDVSVRKMLFREPRSYSTFVVDVGPDLSIFNDVVQTTFWPALTVVKEFKNFLKRPRTVNNLI